jgi:hypothetical protein
MNEPRCLLHHWGWNLMVWLSSIQADGVPVAPVSFEKLRVIDLFDGRLIHQAIFVRN